MRRKFKRLTAFLLSAAMVFPFFGEYPSGTFDFDWGFDWSVSAAEIVANGTCGAEDNESSVTWSLDSDGTLTIRGTGAMADYRYSSGAPTSPWIAFADAITNVVIEDGVTSIGIYAFSELDKLTSVTIPSSVKSIGSHAFFSVMLLLQLQFLQALHQ